MSPIVLVTGGNRGIGLAVVEALAVKGAIVIIGSKDPKSGEEALKSVIDNGGRGSVVQLDVSSDESIAAAVKTIEKDYGHLDVLFNNAAVALLPAPDGSDTREVFNTTLNVNVCSVAVMIEKCLPLLKTSSDPRVVNVSYSRGSFARTTTVKGRSFLYSTSKAALNFLTVEMAKFHEGVKFHSVTPGPCLTGMGIRGTKDPSEGAKVIVELAMGEDKYGNAGFWEIEGDNQEPQRVPW